MFFFFFPLFFFSVIRSVIRSVILPGPIRSDPDFVDIAKFCILSLTRIYFADRVSGRAVRISSRAVLVFPALSLLHVRLSHETFFLMGFHGNGARDRTGHMLINPLFGFCLFLLYYYCYHKISMMLTSGYVLLITWALVLYISGNVFDS